MDTRRPPGKRDPSVSSTVNLTDSDAAYIVAMGINGKWQVTVVVKAAYVWDQRGQVTLTEPAPPVAMDEFAGDPTCLVKSWPWST